MGKLNDIGLKYGTDKSTRVHNYLNIYEKYFESIRNDELTFLEIGILRGQSMNMWLEYFTNTLSKFYGIDDIYQFEAERFKLFCGKQEDRIFLNSIANGKCFDIIIDDGGHTMEEQQISLGVLFPFVREGGLYIIEDLNSSVVKPGRCNKTKTKNTTIRMIKDLVSGKKIESDFMKSEEIQYLLQNTKECLLYLNKIAFIRKSTNILG